ncbi:MULTISPECIES: SRPBCC family protein [Actinokineospora]|uniref:Activator of HSP90 ATPase n=1 Tax=Actinokineospora fastidiosa TaxID=1816 RepID=A0A918GND4_9PSEU|nr:MULTISPECIES: SRPBCC family protein [Actinokineospora]UVS78034.1 Activator of Hsp90 ATPase [Actinokineospora sp. UTMC 2448]GGS50189.1 activator of HSP90 ATPase [Actinokineospora fastidiosa]
MTIDVDHQINAVSRTIGSRTLEAGEARVLTVSQTYKGEVEDVWDALTNPERLPRWFLPVTGELRLGGRYQLEGNAGGVVERCDPPTSFAATWEFGGDVSWIEVTLTPVEAGVRFQLEHVAHVDDERWAEYGPGAVGIGWDLGIMGLAEHLSGSPAVEPSSAAEWTASAEGVAFMRASNERWREASVAAGTDPAEAQAAADRVFAAYTAAP